jgi:hypothetical protein
VAVSDHIGSYHGRGHPSAFCYVEYDGSVDSEIIYQKLRLDRKETARRFALGIETVSDAMRMGDVTLDSRCGWHTHVDVGHDPDIGTRCYSMTDIESLYHLTNYCEDTLYRLASANWKAHRAEMQSEDYSPMAQKGLRGPSAIGNWATHHRGAVNFSPFLASRGGCHCGAFSFGTWSDCTCDLGRNGYCPTIEFRVFNATANPRKIRAYTALCLALIAYAQDHICAVESFPVNEWRGTENEPEETALRFMLTQLPLTDDERRDLLYCAERSSLRSVIPEDIADSLPLPGQVALAS